MTQKEYEKRLLKKCAEIGLKPEELSTSMLTEIESQIYDEDVENEG
jgi:hypothetical protein